MEAMDMMLDKSSSISDMVDAFVSYKLNRFKTKVDVAFKKIRGEVVCDSDVIMTDLLEPSYLINRI
jgi:hypothetical protein